MACRALPLTLLVVAAAADGRGLRGLAFYLLLAAIPVGAACVLAGFARLVDFAVAVGDAPAARLDSALCATGLALVVVSAAARSSVPPEAAVPPLAGAALGGALFLLAVAAGLALMRALVESRAGRVAGSEA